MEVQAPHLVSPDTEWGRAPYYCLLTAVQKRDFGSRAGLHCHLPGKRKSAWLLLPWHWLGRQGSLITTGWWLKSWFSTRSPLIISFGEKSTHYCRWWSPGSLLGPQWYCGRDRKCISLIEMKFPASSLTPQHEKKVGHVVTAWQGWKSMLAFTLLAEMGLQVFLCVWLQ